MAYRRGQYGKYGDIGKFGILREYGTPEIGDSIFNLAATDYGNTKIKPRICPTGQRLVNGVCKPITTITGRKCKDGSSPPCPEGEVPEKCDWGEYADGTCKPEPVGKGKPGVGITVDGEVVQAPGSFYIPGHEFDPKHYVGADPTWAGGIDYPFTGTPHGFTQGVGWTDAEGNAPYYTDELLAEQKRMAGLLSNVKAPERPDLYAGTGAELGIGNVYAGEGRQFLDLGGEEFDFQRASDVRTGEALETLRLQEQEELDARIAQRMLKTFSLLDVGETYKKAEDELDEMVDKGLLVAADLTTAKQNLQEEKAAVVAEKTEARTDSGDSGEKKKTEKTKKKTRRPPQKAATIKAKTKTKTAASRASVAATAAAMSNISGASKAQKTRMSRVVDPWAFEDKRGGRR